MKNRQSASKGCLLGLAIGDALGTTLEFAPRDSYTALTDMIGGGHLSSKLVNGPMIPAWRYA